MTGFSAQDDRVKSRPPIVKMGAVSCFLLGALGFCAIYSQLDGSEELGISRVNNTQLFTYGFFLGNKSLELGLSAFNMKSASSGKSSELRKRKINNTQSSLDVDADLRLGHEQIPRLLWFTHDTNVLAGNDSKNEYSTNVLRSIEKYRKAWNGTEVPVNFLEETDCREFITKAEPKLVPYFESEPIGAKKDDMCVAAALCVRGGYYFDSEVKTVEIVEVEPQTSFASVLACNGHCFYKGFIASTPFHPILTKSLRLLLDGYRDGGIDSDEWSLETYMAIVFDELPESEQGKVFLLEEYELDFSYEDEDEAEEIYEYENKLYPDVQRQGGKGDPCNIVFHDPMKEKIYFFMHFLGSRMCRRRLIPHELWFTYEDNILETKEPKTLYDNVVKTIERYRNFWGEPEATVHFLTDQDCAAAIQRVFPKLLPFFASEPTGAYKGDMCRNVAMYRRGGYYMDLDMQVVKAVKPKEKTTFITATSCGQANCIYNAFFACSPFHPLIYRSLEKMLLLYETRGSDMLGPWSMKQALDNLPEEERENVELLEEVQLDVNENPQIYPSLPRQPESTHCNWVVHDPGSHDVYFFSRFVGAGACKSQREEILTLGEVLG